MGINLYSWVLFVCLFKSIQVEKKAHYSWLHIQLDGYHFSKYHDNEILPWEQVYTHWQNNIYFLTPWKITLLLLLLYCGIILIGLFLLIYTLSLQKMLENMWLWHVNKLSEQGN